MRPLTYILLFIFLTCVFTLVGAATIKGDTIELTPAEMQACKEQVGCTAVSNEFLEKVLAYIELLQRQAKEAKGKSCA